MAWPFSNPSPDADEEPADIAPWPGSAPGVTETENPVTATLYGPDGAVLIEIRERQTVPFGYR